MQIAITGGSGRIGRAVTKLALAEGHQVVSIDRVAAPEDAQTHVRYIQAEVTDYDAFHAALEGCDGLIHLAAYPSPRGHADYVVHNNNVIASYNALSAAASLGIMRVCQASSVNAIGAAYSRWPRYDYFPVDERHPTYNEDPYSLSKWIAEQQGDSFARLHESMAIASLRFHWVMPDRATVDERRNDQSEILVKHLWGYTLLDAAARACLLSLSADFVGHELFFINAPDTMMDTPSLDLKERYFPDVPIRGDMNGNRSFFSTDKAERLLGWSHDV